MEVSIITERVCVVCLSPNVKFRVERARQDGRAASGTTFHKLRAPRAKCRKDNKSSIGVFDTSSYRMYQLQITSHTKASKIIPISCTQIIHRPSERRTLKADKITITIPTRNFRLFAFLLLACWHTSFIQISSFLTYLFELAHDL